MVAIAKTVGGGLGNVAAPPEWTEHVNKIRLELLNAFVQAGMAPSRIAAFIESQRQGCFRRSVKRLPYIKIVRDWLMSYSNNNRTRAMHCIMNRLLSSSTKDRQPPTTTFNISDYVTGSKKLLAPEPPAHQFDHDVPPPA